MSGLTEFENAVICKLLDGDHPVLGKLRQQLNHMAVGQREDSGVGCFLDFGNLKCAKFQLGQSNFEIGDVIAISHDEQTEIGCLLFVRNGVLDFLEMFVISGAWPEDLSDYSLFYLRGNVSLTKSENRDMRRVIDSLPPLEQP